MQQQANVLPFTKKVPVVGTPYFRCFLSYVGTRGPLWSMALLELADDCGEMTLTYGKNSSSTRFPDQVSGPWHY